MKNFQYFGLFLDEETKKGLLDVFLTYLEDNHILHLVQRMYIDHCTLLHHTQNDINVLTFCECCEGAEFVITITSIGTSNKAAAFKVELQGISCANRNPHITIATFNDGKPVDSNNITEWKDIEPISIKTTLKKVN